MNGHVMLEDSMVWESMLTGSPPRTEERDEYERSSRLGPEDYRDRSPSLLEAESVRNGMRQRELRRKVAKILHDERVAAKHYTRIRRDILATSDRFSVTYNRGDFQPWNPEILVILRDAFMCGGFRVTERGPLFEISWAKNLNGS